MSDSIRFLEPNDNGDVVRLRRQHAKSKNGCDMCKRRRVKCDEQLPICGSCRKRKLTCVRPRPDDRRFTEAQQAVQIEKLEPCQSLNMLQLKLLYSFLDITVDSVVLVSSWRKAVPLAFKVWSES
jgi:hypothetical protein